ncbi:hypothetical protein ACRRTK_000253 [Alexandromys fortis]
MLRLPGAPPPRRRPDGFFHDCIRPRPPLFPLSLACPRAGIFPGPNWSVEEPPPSSSSEPQGGSQDSLQAGDQCEEGVCIEESPEGVGERSSSGRTPFQQPAGGLSSGPGHPDTKKFEAVLLYRADVAPVFWAVVSFHKKESVIPDALPGNAVCLGVSPDALSSSAVLRCLLCLCP